MAREMNQKMKMLKTPCDSDSETAVAVTKVIFLPHTGKIKIPHTVPIIKTHKKSSVA